MWLASLSLTNFRNYRRLELKVPQGTVVCYGDNAQGKSNLLEAIYILASTRSHRAEAERELVRWGAREEEGIILTRLRGEVVRASGPLEVEINLMGVDKEEGIQMEKALRVQGIPRRATEYFGKVRAVMFCPTDIGMVRGPPSIRRRYLDNLLSLLDSSYLKAWQRYQKVLFQRNALLRRLREEGGGEEELEFWDNELSSLGASLIYKRLRFLKDLGSLAGETYSSLAGEALVLRYVPTVKGDTERELAKAFTTALEAGRLKELAQGETLAGPHRDDLQLLVKGVDMRVYASRGEERTIALALKFAEGRSLASLGETPILLLDDVLSELDLQHRHFVQERAREFEQVWLTTTDLDRLEPSFLSGASVFKVERGVLAPGP